MAAFAQGGAVPVATAVPAPMAPANSVRLDDTTIHDNLCQFGFPAGLARVVATSVKNFPLRIWIVDNSGSMSTGDGHRLVSAGSQKKMISCTRWEELRETVLFHGDIADATQGMTCFRLLNPPLGGTQQVYCPGGRNLLSGTMNSQPTGYTPLCAHVRQVVGEITAQKAQLQQSGQKAVLVIASDGASSDGNLGPALSALRNLPVWVVVRLCTDDDQVVDYWNNIDDEIELDMDVLDDLTGEAAEVQGHNPWINYAQPLHRAREWGCHHKLFDILDERPFRLGEMKEFCELLLGVSEMPHPEVDWDAFQSRLEECLKKEKPVWNPIEKRKCPWINIKQLRRSYGQQRCSVS